jgi:hypothetical protein
LKNKRLKGRSVTRKSESPARSKTRTTDRAAKPEGVILPEIDLTQGDDLPEEVPPETTSRKTRRILSLSDIENSIMDLEDKIRDVESTRK